MPNYCDGGIVIESNTPQELVKFVRKYLLKPGGKNGELNFTFKKIIPEPKTPQDCDPIYVIQNKQDALNHHLGYKGKKRWFNWYDWRCNTWGTKWDACSAYVGLDSIDDILKDGITKFSISFTTAWSPAIPVILEWQKQNPNIKIIYDYYEPGVGFAGILHEDGYDECITVDYDNQDCRDWLIDHGFESEDYFAELDAEKEEENAN